MKFILLILSLTSVTAIASTCESVLLEKISKDSNIRVVKMIDSYSCGANACAVTFEHDSQPYPNLNVLAFLDSTNNIQVLWVPVKNEIGYENQSKKKVNYVSIKANGENALTLKASVETARDAIFWPRPKIYFEETLNCIKN